MYFRIPRLSEGGDGNDEHSGVAFVDAFPVPASTANSGSSTHTASRERTRARVRAVKGAMAMFRELSVGCCVRRVEDCG